MPPLRRARALRFPLISPAKNAAVIISTHLISDIEQVLDEVIFINQGQLAMTASVDEIRQERGMSVDALFREVYKC